LTTHLRNLVKGLVTRQQETFPGNLFFLGRNDGKRFVVGLMKS
jgi:hypothetical protein